MGERKHPEKKTVTGTHRPANAHSSHTYRILAVTAVRHSGLRGGHRGQSTACLCVCAYPVVNRDKRHMQCHRLSPLSLLPPSQFFTLRSLAPVSRQEIFFCHCPGPPPPALHLLPASFSSSNPNPLGQLVKHVS